MLGLGLQLHQYASSGGGGASGVARGSSLSNSNSVYLDGTNDYMSQPDGAGENVFSHISPASTAVSWTIGFYVKLSDVNSFIFWKGVYATSKFLTIHCNSNGDIAIWGMNGSSTKIKTEWDTNLSTDTWYHVVITSDGSATDRVNTCYINGVAKSINTVNSVTVTSNTPVEYYTSSELLITSSLDNLAYYEMYLDTIATWDDDLTAASVLALYNTHANNYKSNFGNYDQAAALLSVDNMKVDVATATSQDFTLVNGVASSTDLPYE